ncbi:type II toxin-antitoxin system RelB/DinJ family antitoxin [Companilactobacillus mishanensis]|uniref:Type II toxin-antitoxin system RelB/DinJ family antitoxin n=1 Tax=Companilactobacillus mishanensis TaxID=2486008 RepID=A0ABW9P9I4_9LACO|nr:type II toxin-antitoxin system RelB/DinJ family antitoxin [Companilactobacillus mishanensis]MQS45926.1 type II toxin-antitoxin system RelB/DinJ family antitoxin [Companilactobacillus mishanensis]
MINKQSQKKARIQVQVDQDLKDSAEEVLNDLGMNSTTAINVLFKRIVATESFPVNLSLTEKEKATRELQKSISKIPVRKIQTDEDVSKWLDETSDDE